MHQISALHQVLKCHYLRADKAPLEIGVYFSGRLRRLGPLLDGPGPALILTRSEKRDEPQQCIGCLDQPVQAGLGDPQIIQKHLLFIALQFSDLRLQLRTHGDHLGTFLGGHFRYLFVVGIVFVVGESGLIQVCRVDDRFEGEQLRCGDERRILLTALIGTSGAAFVEPGEQLLKDFRFPCGLLITRLYQLGGLLHPALDHLHIRHDEFYVNDLDVSQWIGGALHVDDIGVVKAAHHMNDGVRGPNIGEKFVPQPLSLGGSLH